MLATVGPLEVVTVVGIAVYVTLSYLVAKWAAKKGYSFALFFVVALVVSFVLTWIVVIFLPDKVAPLSNEEKLARLAELNRGGILSNAEYAEEKAKLLPADPS